MTRRRFQRTNRGSVSRRELLLTVSLVVLAGVAVLSLGFTYTYGEDPAESLLTADTPPNMTEYDSPEAAADDMGQADALYLLADDSAVLVYESDSSAGAGATQLGADVTQQLTELLLGLSVGPQVNSTQRARTPIPLAVMSRRRRPHWARSTSSRVSTNCSPSPPAIPN